MHPLYEFEVLFPVIQLHAEKKSGFLGAKKQYENEELIVAVNAIHAIA